jgi:putative membrane protein
MKQQWTLIFALLFALIIAVFSVINVESVPVDYVFGTAQFPLIMVILGSALAGGFVVGLFGTIRMVQQNRTIRMLQRELLAAKEAAKDAATSAASAAAIPTAPEPVVPNKAEPSPNAGEDTK